MLGRTHDLAPPAHSRATMAEATHGLTAETHGLACACVYAHY